MQSSYGNNNWNYKHTTDLLHGVIKIHGYQYCHMHEWMSKQFTIPFYTKNVRSEMTCKLFHLFMCQICTKIITT